MKKLLKQFVLIGLCIVMTLSLAACKDIDRDSALKLRGDYVPQFYTIGDVEGITAERKCEINVSSNGQVTSDSIVYKNTGETEKTFIVAYPYVSSIRYNDPFEMVTDSEPFMLYGGIGSIKMWDIYEGSYSTKLTNKEYFRGLDTPVEDLPLDETVTVYEFEVLDAGEIDISVRLEYDDTKSRPFFDMFMWTAWDWSFVEKGKNSSVEANGRLYSHWDGEYNAVVIMGEDIENDALKISAVDLETKEPAEVKITGSVMTVEEMLLKSLTESYKYKDVWNDLDDSERRNLYDTVLRTFLNYKENGMPAVMITKKGIERPFVVFDEGLETYGVRFDNQVSEFIDKLRDEYEPRLEYLKFYDISLLINQMCFKNIFRAAEITVPAGEERIVTMKYRVKLDRDETDNRSGRLNILPAAVEDAEITSFEVTIKLTDDYYISSQNLGLEESDGVYTASLDPYKEGFTIALSRR